MTPEQNRDSDLETFARQLVDARRDGDGSDTALLDAARLAGVDVAAVKRRARELEDEARGGPPTPRDQPPPADPGPKRRRRRS